MIAMRYLIQIFWAPALVLFLHLILSFTTHLYWTYQWLDIPAHFLGGVSIAYGGVQGLQILLRNGYCKPLPRLFVFLCIVSFVALAAVLWELVEFSFDHILGTVMQVTIQDTMGDFVNGLLGGAFLFVFIFLVKRNVIE